MHPSSLVSILSLAMAPDIALGELSGSLVDSPSCATYEYVAYKHGRTHLPSVDILYL